MFRYIRDESLNVISTRCVVNKLRELKYVFQDRRHRVDLWRKKGGTHCVTLPRKNHMSETAVRSTLQQCGVAIPEIDQFVRDTKS
jgi:hypothetical protein